MVYNLKLGKEKVYRFEKEKCYKLNDKNGNWEPMFLNGTKLIPLDFYTERCLTLKGWEHNLLTEEEYNELSIFVKEYFDTPNPVLN